ncbi:MAG: UDP-glucose dehydrogenase family protein [Candidatus Hodarchaeales archaeon]|jgi:UDPglucose 6-dehydrogenase
MKLGVIGLGYVGLTTALGLTQLGHEVVGLEIDQEKLNSIRKGIMPFYEKGLSEILNKVLDKQFFPTNDFNKVIIDTKALFICVPTPSAEDGSIDLSILNNLAKDIAKSINDFTEHPFIIIKSTVVPGTTLEVAQIINEISKLELNQEFHIAMVPEFLRQGSALRDFQNPARIIFGVQNKHDYSHRILEEIFKPLTCPKVVTGVESAEFTKYASNSFLALKITFSNELANLIDKFNLAKSNRKVNVNDIVNLMGLDHRINPAFMKAGVGFGGSCFPKDVRALAAVGRYLESPMKLLDVVTKVNDQQPHVLLNHLKEEVKELNGRNIGVLGLSFKPNTDDIRETPARTIIKELEREGAYIHAWDPLAEKAMEKEFPNVCYHDNLDDLFPNIQAALIITEWPEIKKYITENHIPKHMIIIDGRGIVPNATRTIGQSHL